MKKLGTILAASCGLLTSAAFCDKAWAEDEPTASELWAGFVKNTSAQAFASGYYLFNSAIETGPYNVIGYPYAQNQGFGVTFAGLDAAYDGDKMGVTVNLRFGPGAPLLSPLAPIKQAYATWKVSDTVALDLGFFDTVYGAEVADEWLNVNFSRGALYFNRQPFNHMGLRASIGLGDSTNLALFLANGPTGISGLGGTPVAGFDVPSLGTQISFGGDSAFLAIGYMVGPNGTDGNNRIGHFFDLVNTYTLGKTSIILNVDVTVDPEPGTSTETPGDDELALLYGASLAVQFELSDSVSIGARGEFLGSNDEASPEDYFVTLTGTLRYKPVENLIISIEPRGEFSDQEFFIRDEGEDNAKWYFGAIIGATAVIGN